MNIFWLTVLRYSSVGLLVLIGACIGCFLTKHKISGLAIIGEIILMFGLIYLYIYFKVAPTQTTLKGIVFIQLISLILALLLLGPISVNIDYKLANGILISVLGVFVAGAILGIICMLSMFSSNNYYTQLSSNSISSSYYQTDKKAKMPTIDQNTKKLPLFNTTKTVYNWANTSLNDVTKHPSAYVVKDGAILQYYHGKLVYVIPVDYDNSVLQHAHVKYLPGYLIVDAMLKDAKPKFIKRKIYYSPTHYWNQNSERQAYNIALKNNLTFNYEEQLLEIDPQGTPYYISTATKQYFADMSSNKNYKQMWVITVNGINGKTNIYPINKCPKWISTTITPQVASDELDTYATYKNTSYYNFLFFKDNADQIVANGRAVIGSHGKIYYVDYLQNYNRNQKAVDSYVYIDARTGKINRYQAQKNVIVPKVARKVAINAMNEKRWKTDLPLMYKINGIPTWLITITDRDSVFRKYALVRADGLGTTDTVAIGDNAQDALINYRALFNGTSQTVSGSENGKLVTKTGVISKIGRFDDNNIRFKLANSTYVYNLSTKQSQNAVFLSKGDHVKVTGRLQNNLVVTINIKTINEK